MLKRLPIFSLALTALIFLGQAVSVDVPSLKRGFFSDEASYYAMAYSLAFDGDIRYEQKDLERVYARGYTGGPSGIFLRRDADDGNLYYAKAFVYSLAAAPFVRVFGDNGFFIFHAVLFAAVLAAGYAYLRRTSPSSTAALYAITYFVASISLLYFFWIMPEWFNLSVGFLATFLWLYKERPPGLPGDVRWRPTGWLAGGWTDYAAALLYGVAAYSKPPSVIMLAPLLGWTLLHQRRFARAVALGLVAASVVLVLFGITHAITGDWNYMGGDRRTFTGPYPFQYSDRPFDTIGTPMITEVSDLTGSFPYLHVLLADVIYVLIGRNGGVLIYLLPAVLALLAYLSSAHRRWLSPHTLLLAAAALTALGYLTYLQVNWIGGGGTVGSRYFLTFYYAPFFAIPAVSGLLSAGVAWVVWALFLAQIMLYPFTTTANPSLHTKRFPFKLLPPELGMLNDLPFNTNPRARRVKLREDDPFDLYFLDDNTYLREGETEGFWVKSHGEAEIVLRAYAPVSSLLLDMQNGPVSNRVSVVVDGQRQSRALGADQIASLRFEPITRFRYGENYVYRFVVSSAGGGVPMMHIPASQDFRHLGAFVSLRVELE